MKSYSDLKAENEVVIDNEVISVKDILFVAKENIGISIEFTIEGCAKENGDIYYEAVLNNVRGIVHFQAENPYFKSLEQIESIDDEMQLDIVEDEDLLATKYFYKEAINKAYWVDITEETEISKK